MVGDTSDDASNGKGGENTDGVWDGLGFNNGVEDGAGDGLSFVNGAEAGADDHGADNGAGDGLGFGNIAEDDENDASVLALKTVQVVETTLTAARKTDRMAAAAWEIDAPAQVSDTTAQKATRVAATTLTAARKTARVAATAREANATVPTGVWCNGTENDCDAGDSGAEDDPDGSDGAGNGCNGAVVRCDGAGVSRSARALFWMRGCTSTIGGWRRVSSARRTFK